MCSEFPVKDGVHIALKKEFRECFTGNTQIVQHFQIYATFTSLLIIDFRHLLHLNI